MTGSVESATRTLTIKTKNPQPEARPIKTSPAATGSIVDSGERVGKCLGFVRKDPAPSEESFFRGRRRMALIGPTT